MTVEILIGVVSLLLFIGGLLAIPALVRRLPPDYFVRTPPRRSFGARLLRNGLGAILIIAGVAMLILPGPGIVGVILGLAVLDLPIKHRILRAILRREKIQEAIQKLRSKAGKQPFVIPQAA